MRLPELRVGNIDHARARNPGRSGALPNRRDIGVERGELRRHPGLGVDAVGDAGDRNFVLRHTRPDILPKRPADFAVQFAHAVRVAARSAAPGWSC